MKRPNIIPLQTQHYKCFSKMLCHDNNLDIEQEHCNKDAEESQSTIVKDLLQYFGLVIL